LARYYHDEFAWTWPEDVVDITSEEGVGQDGHNNGGEEVSSSDEEDEEPHNDDEAQNQEEHDIAEEGQEADGNEELIRR
jgi:hypothetical protein